MVNMMVLSDEGSRGMPKTDAQRQRECRERKKRWLNEMVGKYETMLTMNQGLREELERKEVVIKRQAQEIKRLQRAMEGGTQEGGNGGEGDEEEKEEEEQREGNYPALNAVAPLPPSLPAASGGAASSNSCRVEEGHIAPAVPVGVTDHGHPLIVSAKGGGGGEEDGGGGAKGGTAATVPLPSLPLVSYGGMLEMGGEGGGGGDVLPAYEV